MLSYQSLATPTSHNINISLVLTELAPDPLSLYFVKDGIKE